MDAIEHLRARLKAHLPPEQVTDRRVTFCFDEDSAAFADIAVQRHAIELVVLRSKGSWDRIMTRVWLSHAPEVWVVCEDALRIYRPGTAPFDATAPIAPLKIPDLLIDPAELR